MIPGVPLHSSDKSMQLSERIGIIHPSLHSFSRHAIVAWVIDYSDNRGCLTATVPMPKGGLRAIDDNNGGRAAPRGSTPPTST